MTAYFECKEGKVVKEREEKKLFVCEVCAEKENRHQNTNSSEGIVTEVCIYQERRREGREGKGREGKGKERKKRGGNYKNVKQTESKENLVSRQA